MRDDERVTGWALAARDGDDRAVEEFVRATQLDVRRYVTHLSGEAQAADDLVQDTYVRALRSLPRFEGRSSARTWLLTIARRVVADRIRTHAVRPRLSATDDWQSAAERVQPRGVPGFEEGIALADLLATLSAQRREAFVLTQLLGLPYAAAAGVMGCPVGTVRSRVARARETLIALLAEAESEAEAGAEAGAGARGGTGAGADAGAEVGAGVWAGAGGGSGASGGAGAGVRSGGRSGERARERTGARAGERFEAGQPGAGDAAARGVPHPHQRTAPGQGPSELRPRRLATALA